MLSNYYILFQEQKMFEGVKTFEVREMFDMKERNYDWESFKLQVPKKYSANPLNNQVPPGAIFGKKDNYLDQLQKQKKAIPSPTDYKTNEVKQRPKSGKMDKAERMTFSDQVKTRSNKENIPGPGSYFKRPKSAAPTTTTSHNEKKETFRQHYLNEVEYLAISTPGIGEYNLTKTRHISGPKLMKRANKSRLHMNSERQKQSKQSKINPINSCPGTFAWLKGQGIKKNSNFFGVSQRFVIGSKYEKRPAPNTYKSSQEWNKDTNIMKLVCNPMSITQKSVYYR